ncbi:flagellar filament capping protein FliD [Sphingomonas sp.]|uniref:flagellar filament capping protein FliD n=1 Tax=Sphingomonas sp. TaxID=28214 RepID=UPI0035BC8EF5
MTTTTSTTSTSTATSATQSLLTSLGTGSGIDTSALVTSLVQAQFAAKTSTLTAKAETLTKQISGVATLKSTVTAFATALESLVKGGTLQTQPTVSDTGVLTATAIPGAKLLALSSTIAVGRLATAQAAASGAIRDKDGVVATATTALSSAPAQFKITLGTATYAADGTSMTDFAPGIAAAITVDIPAANSGPAGIAAAINANKAGVTATVVTGANGAAYLSLKGATGTTQAFTLEATTDPDGTMAQFRVMPPLDDGNGNTAPATTNLTSKALNAQLTVDGIAVERAGNTVGDLVAGVKLQLSKISAIPVTLGATRPTDGLTQAVNDFVETYNQVLAVITEQTNAVDGPLRADPAAKSLLKSLQGITLKSLVPGSAAGSPATLSAIGVTTNRDGTLAVSSARLTSALATDPDAVEAMFAYSADSSAGLSAVLKTLSTEVANTTYGLGASTARYAKAQTLLATDQVKVADQSTSLTTRLTKQYASMNAAVSAYKSTQAYIEQQVAIWTKSN